MERVFNFVNNIEILNNNNYEKVLGHILTEFSGDQWFEKFCVLFLLYNKFDKDYDVLLETAKDTLKAHRDFNPSMKDLSQLIELAERLLPHYKDHTKLFRYVIPPHIVSIMALRKVDGTSEIREEYLNYIMEDTVKYTEHIEESGIFPEKIYGIIEYEDEDKFLININNSESNSLYYQLKLDSLEHKLDFLPQLAIKTNSEKEQYSSHIKSEDNYVYEPKKSNLKGMMFPVYLKIRGGCVWVSLDTVEEQKTDIPLNIDIGEAIESAISLDPLILFKIINREDNFKDMEKIIETVLNKKNKTLSNILREFYEDKYSDTKGVVVN